MLARRYWAWLYSLTRWDMEFLDQESMGRMCTRLWWDIG